ncbi:MAG: AraC family transcriptional regulator [Bacteroidales bacterium]|nr:AraC family transcriptional regulator [Bacteroidales bacterium]
MNNCAIFNYNHSSEIVKTDLYESWICRINKGKAKVVFEQKEYKVSADTIFFVQEGATFKVLSSSRDMQMEVLVFKEALMNVVYSLCGAEADFGELETMFWSDKNIDEQYGRIMAMDYELLKVAVQNTNLIAHNKMIMTGLVHLLITLYNAAGVSSETKQGNNSKRSRMLLNHFFELVGENVMMGQRDVSFYAKKLCISERYLSKLCKAETGKTPKILINQSLIGEIKNALLTTEMSHQQIADRFGFPDQSAFGQFFKRQEGISPSEFRKKYK